jgi:phage terminase large subunit-like protein
LTVATASAYAGKGLSPRKKVSGKPFTVEHFRRWSARYRLKDGKFFVLEDYEAAFLEDLFARDTNGLPVFSELWLIIPEGNGKTTFFALVVLYTIEFKPEAWVPVAASARDQAVDLTYRIAAGFVQRNGLERKGDEGEFRLHPGYRQIVHEESLGAAKIFASDAASGDGVDPTLAVIEELHRLAKMDLYETWAGKLDKSGGQLVVASTAGEPGSPFEELRSHIRKMATEHHRDGCFLRAVAPGVVLHEYALPADGDPEDLELVAAANPFSAKTVEALAKKRAKPSWNLAHWRRFTCNLPTRGEMAAIQEGEWYGAAVEDLIPEGEPIWLGLDLGWVYDTTAMVPLWMRDEEFRLLGPATILEPPRDGNQLDAHLVERSLLEIHERNPVHTVVMDMTNGEQLSQWIEEEIGARVVDRKQTNSLAVVDYARFMEALREGWLHHTGDPGLTSHALNAVAVVLPGGDTKFYRPKESRTVNQTLSRLRVIDALVAAAMVHSTAVAEGGDILSPEELAAVGW